MWVPTSVLLWEDRAEVSCTFVCCKAGIVVRVSVLMHRLKVLIADDEPLARERLQFLLSTDADVEVTGECRNGQEVIAALKKNRFDVTGWCSQHAGDGVRHGAQRICSPGL